MTKVSSFSVVRVALNPQNGARSHEHLPLVMIIAYLRMYCAGGYNLEALP